MNAPETKIKKPKILYCSFCGKSQHEVRKLIAGKPAGRGKEPVICDECIDLCNDIIEEEALASADTPARQAALIASQMDLAMARVRMLTERMHLLSIDLGRSQGDDKLH